MSIVSMILRQLCNFKDKFVRRYKAKILSIRHKTTNNQLVTILLFYEVLLFPWQVVVSITMLFLWQDCFFDNFYVTIAVVSISQNITVVCGGLSGTFKAAQFHFHWGNDSTKGSEHTLNGNQYPMEASEPLLISRSAW